ncbi:unnamed protein product [Agarophyton chilense]
MSSHSGFKPKSVLKQSPVKSSIPVVPKHGTETVEQLRDILKSKEMELENLQKKKIEYQARLDRVAFILKSSEN